jgi:SAM-dependent methyltransferase
LGRATTATILFTDLVGSTALSARLGATRAERLFSEHFEVAGRVVDDHGGEVVKNLGDGVMARFGAVTDAVECAVALQQAVEAGGRSVPDALTLRVGLSVGEVTAEGGDYFGTPVVEAARLCAEAQPRQVLASSLVRQLAGTRCAHAFRALGSVALKGLPDMLVDEVAWAPLVERGLSANFGHVDDAVDPEHFVTALNLLREAPFLTAVRQRVLDVLAPRPGERLLDVGSGVGDDALELGRIVGDAGGVVGVDYSSTMLEEAARRALAIGADNVEFRLADAQDLPFDPDSFDGCRSDRTFQYLVDPMRAVREMVRVTRPDGRVVVSDTDWETSVFDHADVELTDRINRAWCDTRESGRVGHQLYGLFKRAGLVDVAVSAHTNVVTSVDVLYQGVIDGFASQAVSAGAVTDAEASRWVATLDAADREGRFFRSFTMFVVYGRVP